MTLRTLLLLTYTLCSFASDTEELYSGNFEQLSDDQPVLTDKTIQQAADQPRMDYLNTIRPLLPTWQEYANGTLTGKHLIFKRNKNYITMSIEDIDDASKSGSNLQELLYKIILKEKLDYSHLPSYIKDQIDQQK